jgi:hypothetical protein
MQDAFMLMSSLACFSALKNDAKCSSETSFYFQWTARHCIPDYVALYPENVKSRVGRSPWLQIERPVFYYWRYQIF